MRPDVHTAIMARAEARAGNAALVVDMEGSLVRGKIHPSLMTRATEDFADFCDHNGPPVRWLKNRERCHLLSCDVARTSPFLGAGCSVLLPDAVLAASWKLRMT